jgi:lipopolysaccharide transport system ATP-binding protein
MRKKEIDRKLEEIIDFSGVERYIDTPVKRYSSGMYVRLAFAVAAHLESEILIVDEVLAVGDAEFQKKCLGKMGEVSKGEGRTVLFVSHNMTAVQSLCNRGIFLHNGEIFKIGLIENTITEYNQIYQKNEVNLLTILNDKAGSSIICELLYSNKGVIIKGNDIILKITNNKYKFLNGEEIAIILINENDENIGYFSKNLNEVNNLKLTINSQVLLPGKYKIRILGHIPNQIITFQMKEPILFSINQSFENEINDLNIHKNYSKIHMNIKAENFE